MQGLKRFKSDRAGSTSLMFALSVIPVLGFVGAAVDYARATSARAEMQKALDITALALVADAPKLSDSELAARGQTIFAQAFQPRGSVAVDPVQVARSDRAIKVSGSGSLDTTIMKIVGQDSVRIASTSEAAWGTNRIELSLVLDNTGSMGDVVAGKRKMDELKKAALDFIDGLEAASGSANRISVAIVPFSTLVKVEPDKGKGQPKWLTFEDKLKTKHVKGSDWTKWAGCIADREQGNDLDVRDDGRNENDVRTLHLGVECQPNVTAMRPLTANFNSLRQTLKAMTPSGTTNVTIGMAWGLDTLSSGGPMTGAVPFGTADVRKIMIVLTDGDNTLNRETNQGWRIDRRTEKVCQTVKDKGVTLYTIRLLAGNEKLLQGCASVNPSSKQPLYYDVKDAGRVQAAFQSILNEILGTRLTQ
jgi:Flp pilus assembly protein TadG